MKTFLSTIFAAISMFMASCQTQQPNPFRTSPMGGIVTATFDCCSVYCTRDTTTLFILPSEEFFSEAWEIGNLDNAYYYLSITIDSSTYNIQFPESGQIILPGHIRENFYMLYVMDTDDVNIVHRAINSGPEETIFSNHFIGACNGITP